MQSRSIKAIVVCLLFGVALFWRTYELGAIGLSEDEANKIEAIESYRDGNYLANAEHPMFMKLLGWGSFAIVEKWNDHFPANRISNEAALRFPAALAGALVVFAIYLLGTQLFNPAVGLIAASLWAVDINSIALSRIAKEDALITLFFVLGNYFLLRAKHFHFTEPSLATQNYIACGVSFGMLIGSKYNIPYTWITLFFYDLFRFRKEPRWRLKRPDLFKLYSALLIAFLIVDPIIVKPETLNFLWRHFMHGRITHNGYFMMGELYLNKTYYTLWGTPVYFYPLYLFVKTPILLIATSCLGLFYCFRKIRQDNALFLTFYFVLWLLLLTVPGGKFTRYMITLLPAVILLQALGIFVIYRAAKDYSKTWLSLSLLGVLLCASAGWYIVLDRSYHPFYSFYVAGQGGGRAKEGYYFPPDDFYDAGLRESIAYLCVNAPKGSIVVGNTPAAFEYYQESFGRPDLKYRAMAGRPLDLATEPSFILVQDYRRYIENYYILVFSRAELKPLFVTSVRDIPSVEVYYLSPDPEFAKSPFWKAKHWPGVLKPLALIKPRIKNS